MERYPQCIVILDEGHHISRDSSWQLALRSMQNALKVAFSATCEAEPFSLNRVGAVEVANMGLPQATAREVTSPSRFHMLKYETQKSTEQMLRTKAANRTSLTDAELESVTSDEGYLKSVAELALEKFVKIGGRKNSLDEAIIEVFKQSDARKLEKMIKESTEFPSELSSQVAVISDRLGVTHNRKVLEKVASGEIKWVIAVDMMIEGIDWPLCKNIVMRPRCSMREMVQAMGRALRYVDGEIADIYQLYPNDNPEELFATVRTYLDLPVVHPDVVYRGSRQRYVKTAYKKATSPNIKQSTGELTYIEFLQMYPGDLPIHDIKEWDDVETLIGLESFLLNTATRNNIAYQDPIKLTSYTKPDGEVVPAWGIRPAFFKEQFGVSLQAVRRRFPGLGDEGLVEIIDRIQRRLGKIPPNQAYDKPAKELYDNPQNLIAYAREKLKGKQLPYIEKVPDATIQNHFFYSMTAMNALIKAWSKSWLIPREITSIRSLIKYAGIINIADEDFVGYRDVHSDSIVSIREAFPQVNDILQACKMVAVEAVAQGISNYYQTNGSYVRPPKYRSVVESLRVFGTRASELVRKFTYLRDVSRTLVQEMSAEERERFPFALPPCHAMQEIVIEAEHLASTKYGVPIDIDVFENLSTTQLRQRAFNFMVNRARSYIEKTPFNEHFSELKISSSTNGKSGNDRLFQAIWGVKAGRLKRIVGDLLQDYEELVNKINYRKPAISNGDRYRTEEATVAIERYDRSPVGLLALIAARTDPVFEASYRIYHCLPTWEESMEALANAIFYNNEFEVAGYPSVGFINYNDFAPRFLSANSCALLKYSAYQGGRTQGIREFCKQFNYTPDALFREVNYRIFNLRVQARRSSVSYRFN